MISIREDQIDSIVEDLQKAEFFECHRVPADVVKKAVCKWLEEHIQSIYEDAVWWFRKEGSDLRDLGLPYEDEIQELYEQHCDREAVTVGDKF